jgi:hypothetical protein
VVRRGHSRYGWAETIPSARLREIFHDLALRQEILRPFQGCALPPRRRITWHCGLPKLPDREELRRIQSGDDRPPERVSANVKGL